MFTTQSKLLEKCLLDLTTQILGEQYERDNRALVLNRIREITLEAFQRHYNEEIMLLQQESKRQQSLLERTKREYQDKEQQLLMDLDKKLHDQQMLHAKELRNVQEELADQNKKYTQQLDKWKKEQNLANSQLQQELLNCKELNHVSEQQVKVLHSEVFEYKQKYEQLQSANSLLEMQFKTLKTDSEKVGKENQRKHQQVIDLNIALESEVSNLRMENDQLKMKKQQDSLKYKEALDQLKEKSQNKIKEYKQKLKEADNKDNFISELNEQVKELEQQIEFQQQQHRQALKSLELQYKKQYQTLEQSLELEKSEIHQHLTKSLETTVTDKDREILQLSAENRQLKMQVQNEQDQKQRNQLKSEDISNRLNSQIQQLNNELDQQLQKITALEQEIQKKDQTIKLLLEDIDDIKQFSEQTLNTLRENQDYMSELEREKQQQFEIIQNIQQQLEIEIQGSFSYKRLGEEMESRCRLYKEEHCSLLEEQMRRESLHQQDLEAKDNQRRQEAENFNNQLATVKDNYENQLKKERLEHKLAYEEQSRTLGQMQKELISKESQLETFEKQNSQLISELEQYIQQYTNSLSLLEELKVNEKRISEQRNRDLSSWQAEKHQLNLQLDESKFKYRSLKQKLMRVINRQKEQLGLQLIDMKAAIINKIRGLESDYKSIIQNSLKKLNQIVEQRVNIEKNDQQQIIDNFQREMDKKMDQLRKQYKQNEILIQEEAAIKLKQKIQQIQQHDQSVDDIKNQLNFYIQENDHLQQKLQVQDQLNREQFKKAELEQRQLQQTIQDLQDELYQIQQSADYTVKEREYFEQRYNDLRDKSEKKMDQIQKDYQQQIQQLETIIQPQQRAVSPTLHSHKLSSSSGFHRSPLQTQVSASKTVFPKPPQYSSPSIRTPHKSPINDRTEKTIEELRVEIQQQKEKLSRMKLNFTESQKKSKTLSRY